MSNTQPTEKAEVVVLDESGANSDAESDTLNNSNATRVLTERRLAGLNERVHRYFALVPRLGTRGARRKAGLEPNDILMWNYIQAQHKAMADAKAKVVGELAAKKEG
jgi:hypothetical protein